MAEQVPFDAPAAGFGSVEFADNPEPRCPCLLLLDTSSSMRGEPIAELNAGLVSFKDELLADSLAAKRIEVAVVGFGPAKLISPFQTAEEFQPPTLVAAGDTPMGTAILLGLETLRQRKELYRANGIAFYRPWVFLITDGGPTDQWKEAAAKVQEGEGAKSFAFFAVGVQGANLDALKQIATRAPLKLDGLKFRSLFQWLSNSMKSVSQSTPGDVVLLENPATPGGWAAV
jgi:uncharacterized protein YegL